MNESLDPRLLTVFETFDSFCRQKGVRYGIESDEYYQQGYLIKLGDPALVESHMAGVINNKWIAMEIENREDGTLFSFGVKHLSEDQYKSPTRKMIQKQSAFRSSFGPSRSFGGIGGYSGKLHKKLAEALKLKDNLIAHDNVTTIPAGTEFKIHDPDPSLPDIDWDGTTSNVDMDKLGKAVSPKDRDKFDNVLESTLSEQKSSVGNFLVSKIHEGYTVAADRAFAAGYLTQDERIAMSDAISDALKAFTTVLKTKFPRRYRRELDGAEAISMARGTIGERIEKRISKL